MRDIEVGDIWMWTPPADRTDCGLEYYLISKQDEHADWFGISLNGDDAGEEFEITVHNLENDWVKVA